MEKIIDGINIAECADYQYGNCNDDFCVKNKDCYFKQLKRLEKENEKLRKINYELAKEHKTIGQDLYAEIKNYREENEKLKIYIESNKQEVEQAEDVVMENAQLLQKLEKIKEHIDHFCDICPYADTEEDVCNSFCLLDTIVTPICEIIEEK